MFWLILAAAVSDPSASTAAVPPVTPTPLCVNCNYDTPPRIIHQSRPGMPTEAALAQVEGTITLAVVVSETGEPTDIKVLRSLPMLDDAAVACVREWRFEPARKDGKPVAATVHAEVSFRLDPGQKTTLAPSFLLPPKGRPKETVADLVRRLQDKKDEKRADAAWKLSAVPDAGPEAVAALTTRLGDKSPLVRDRAAVALFALGQDAALSGGPRALMSQRRPAYPEELRAQKAKGTVKLKLLVSGTGRILQARFVERAQPALDEAALVAASRWRYEAGRDPALPFTISTTVAFHGSYVEVDPAPLPAP